MTIEGIWTSEIYGPFGWDSHGIILMENGRIIGGGNRHYSTGTYSLSGKEVKAELLVNYYGPPRTMFGEAKEEFTTQIVGTWKDPVIEGTIHRVDRPQFDLQIRLTKRMDLPAV